MQDGITVHGADLIGNRVSPSDYAPAGETGHRRPRRLPAAPFTRCCRSAWRWQTSAEFPVEFPWSRSMRHRYFAVLAGLLAMAAAGFPAVAAAAPLQPFQAEYRVLRNGKEIGRATLALRDGGNGTWEFSEHTEGTRGMAGMLGIDVDEVSTFRWRDGLPEGLGYRYEQQAAFKSRRRSTEFDWQDMQAFSRDGKRSWTAPLSNGAMDRNLVTIALVVALRSGSRDLTFPVVDKDRVAAQHYVRGPDERLSLPAGRVDAVRVDREREDRRKTTTIWFAQSRGWLPVQIEQSNKGDTVTMQLESTRAKG
jgi:Protein of unknown function (DUF3108)